jgi:hypothetical protein
MQSRPQEGLRAFRTATVAPVLLARPSAISAPLTYCSVTSLPASVMTRARPARTSAPSPPTISAGGRGVPRPASSSGQTSTAGRPSRAPPSLGSALSVPSYRHARPARQAETRTGSELARGRCFGTRVLRTAPAAGPEAGISGCFVRFLSVGHKKCPLPMREEFPYHMENESSQHESQLSLHPVSSSRPRRNPRPSKTLAGCPLGRDGTNGSANEREKEMVTPFRTGKRLMCR